MTRFDRLRRFLMMTMWRILNPPTSILAGLAPWWVVLETTGHRSGEPRRTPLARGPISQRAACLIAVHGRHASWVKNLEASPRVRIQIRGRWHSGVAVLLPFDPQK